MEKDCTRSMIWQALPRAKRDEIVALSKATKQPNLSLAADMEAKNALKQAIHSLLGIRGGAYWDLITDLQNLLTDNRQGGIFTEIRNYITRYETIEIAASQEAARTKGGGKALG